MDFDFPLVLSFPSPFFFVLPPDGNVPNCYLLKEEGDHSVHKCNANETKSERIAEVCFNTKRIKDPSILSDCNVKVENGEHNQANNEGEISVKRLAEGLADAEGNTNNHILIQ